MSDSNPLVDDVSLVSAAISSYSAQLNHPGVGDAFNRIVEALRKHGLYRYPGEAPPEVTRESKRKTKRKGKRS